MFNYLKDTTPTGGFDNGWWGTIQGADAFLRAYGHCDAVDGISTCNLSTSQKAAGSSVQSGGIMVGSILAVYINKALGRRWSLVITGFVSLLGVLIEMTSAVGSPRFSQFVVGKTVASVAMGLSANIVPIYLSETSTASARGFAISMYQNVLIIGFCLAGGIVYATAKRDDAASYLIPIGLQFVAPVAMILFSPFLPESPRWLVWNRRHEDAIVSSTRLFGTDSNNFDAAKYVNDLKIVFEAEMANPENSKWADLFHGPDFRRLLIAIGVQCWQQAQGSGYIINYMVSFLQDSGVRNIFPFMMGLNLVYYGGILSGHYLPDRFGRRPVIINSSIFNAIFMLAIASVNTAVSPSTSSSGSASVALLFLWQVSFGALSPVVWIICTEAAPTRNRERVLSVALFFGFGVSLMITSVSPYVQDKGYGNLGSRIGFIWGAASVIAAVWSFFLVPESKGLSLEQLDYLYEEKVSPREFGKFTFASAVLPHQKSLRQSGDFDAELDGQVASNKGQSPATAAQ
ncbi:hypothetical protein NM208_g10672 [Fusarium decemcellulare]|uniref:Uncharacterized protein n=1 Tax=Fusarium decemcellulare TaxID=57161 RepID=A0ACC1RX14_9HYPO|nr:hypothetical protein NM208_g10672 [Fusarium decemcellulare]